MTTTGRQAFRYAIEKTLGGGGFTAQRRTDELLLSLLLRTNIVAEGIQCGVLLPQERRLRGGKLA